MLQGASVRFSGPRHSPIRGVRRVGQDGKDVACLLAFRHQDTTEDDRRRRGD
jgi:hypothetical protein